MFQSAKDAASRGDFEGAFGILILLEPVCAEDFAFAAKSAKLAGRIISHVGGLRPLKIAFLSSSTSVFIEPLIRLFCAFRGFDAEVRAGEFDSWRRDIADENSWLYSFGADAVIIAPNWRDANFPAISQKPKAEASRFAEELAGYWAALRGRTNAAVIQLNLDIPANDSGGFLGETSPQSRVQTLKSAASMIVEKAAQTGVRVVDAQEIRAKAGSANWEDARMWYSARQHPALPALPAVAAEYARAVNAVFNAPKKVCVLDLDNTLWGGVIGEDGLAKIKLGAPDPEGEAYAAFQKYLLELKERGVLLAVCSKNNEADALLPFEKHPEMAITLGDISAFRANWESKSKNILEIAKELNLGADSFVFVDDNPAEIAEVSAALPQVVCVKLSGDPSDSIRLLSERNLFDAVGVSSDDMSRSLSYAQNAKREAAKSQSASPEDYLKSLEMACEAAEISDVNLERAAQLAGKTNQFNLTTRRHNAEAVNAIARMENAYAKTFRLKDKFGDMGIVGVLLAVPSEGGALEIDTFLLSCRALGRGLENFAMKDLAAFAKLKGFKEIRGEYIPTEKNAQTKDLYAKFGFEKTADDGGRTSWRASPDKIETPEIFIK